LTTRTRYAIQYLYNNNDIHVPFNVYITTTEYTSIFI